MDTIDVFNLNIQFLFSTQNVGRPKIEVAAEFLNDRVPNFNVVPHFNKIQDFNDAFYQQYYCVCPGLYYIQKMDQWNADISSKLQRYSVLDPGSIVPLLDGGTEGF
ncbi:NEDD8-activating enzyme E1 catalytic subunit [Lemmus lemmus]